MRDNYNRTVAEVAAIMPCSEATVRRHWKEWGGFKRPGFRRILFAPETVEWLRGNPQAERR